jgi:hypothetical protein
MERPRNWNYWLSLFRFCLRVVVMKRRVEPTFKKRGPTIELSAAENAPKCWIAVPLLCNYGRAQRGRNTAQLRDHLQPYLPGNGESRRAGRQTGDLGVAGRLPMPGGQPSSGGAAKGLSSAFSSGGVGDSGEAEAGGSGQGAAGTGSGSVGGRTGGGVTGGAVRVGGRTASSEVGSDRIADTKGGGVVWIAGWTNLPRRASGPRTSSSASGSSVPQPCQ